MGLDKVELESVQVGSLIPHSRSMLFLDRILSFDLKTVTGKFSGLMEEKKACVGIGGIVDQFWHIEIMAQGAAALYQLQKKAENKPIELGFLVSISSLEVLDFDPIYAGARVQVNAHLKEEFFPFGYFECELIVGNSVIAKAEMSFVVDENGGISH